MNRYEREIEEILQKIVDFPSDNNRRRRSKPPRLSLWETTRSALLAILFRPTPSNLVIAAVFLAILGFALRDYAPAVAPFASIAAVILFLAVIVQSYRSRRPRYEKRWRGQVIEFPRKKSTSWNELRFRLTIFWRNFRWWISRR